MGSLGLLLAADPRRAAARARLRSGACSASSSPPSALASVVPGGSAAGSALGYRLLTLSGVDGPDAGFALATAGLGSAVVLNIIFWTAPARVDPAARRQPVLRHRRDRRARPHRPGPAARDRAAQGPGAGRADPARRWLGASTSTRTAPPPSCARWPRALRDLASDPKLLSSVIGWATANWLLDAAALWVFLRAFGGVVPLDGLIVAFGLANVLASVPITPGGLGIVEGIYIPTLVGFGLSRSEATLGVISYRLAQYWLPILLGGLAYLSLRVGPWSIERRDRLERLRVLAKDETEIFESGLEWAERYGHRPTDPIDVPAAGADRDARPVAPGARPHAREDGSRVQRPRRRRRARIAVGRRRSAPVASARHDRSRAAVRPLPGGLRRRRRLPALARQDDHRGRRPPLLHDHHEPPPAPHQRLVRRARVACRGATWWSATSCTRWCWA